jgi:Sec-independent protein translocase protein TatA
MSTVEAALAQFIVQTNRSLHIFQKEMKDFKDEMKDFKDEMKEFKDEMKDFKNEMSQYKEDSIRERREMNKQWGALANKMGTIVEDIVAPAVRPVMEKFFSEEVNYIAVNVRKKDSSLGLRGEFDVVATSKSYLFLIETKSSPRIEQVVDFKQVVIPRFRQLFPEFDALQLIPVFSSLRFDSNVIEFATQQGIFAMAYREWDYMDILNFEEISQQ